MTMFCECTLLTFENCAAAMLSDGFFKVQVINEHGQRTQIEREKEDIEVIESISTKDH